MHTIRVKEKRLALTLCGAKHVCFFEKYFEKMFFWGVFLVYLFFVSQFGVKYFNLVLMRLYKYESLTKLALGYSSEDLLASELMEERAKHSGMTCTKCGNDMHLRLKKEIPMVSFVIMERVMKSFFQWRCRASRNSDCSTASIRKGSWFSNSKLSLQQLVGALSLCSRR